MILALDPERAMESLARAVTTSFAEMAFVDVLTRDARGEPTAPGPGEVVRAEIDVLKPLSCRIELECPAELKRIIEDTLFLGEIGKEDDMLLELLNVLAGLFLSAYFGAGTEIKLELPQYLFLSDGAEGEVLAEISGDAEGMPLRVVLRTIRYRY